MHRAGQRGELVWGAVFGSIAVILVWSRLVGLDQSFWNDEVVTVLRYAGEGPRAIFFGDYAPNNHVLFSLLAWTASELFGDSETTYRIWSVVPALGATIWLVWWAYQRFGHVVAATLLLMMTASPLLFVLSREARGYGLAMLATVGLVTQADAALTNPERRSVWLFSAFGLLGLLTLPVFVLPFLLAAIPLLSLRQTRKRIIVGIALSGLVSLIWFSPMLGEIVEHSSQQFGRLIPWHGVVTLSVSQLVFPIYRLLLPDTPNILLTFPRDPTLLTLAWHALTWPLLILGARTLWLAKRARFLAVLVLPPVGTYVILAVGGIWAADRHLSYLAIPVFVLFALGVGRLIEVLRDGYQRLALLAGAGLAIWLVVSFYPVADHVARVPHEATKQVAAAVEQSGTHLTITNSERPAGLRYYIDTTVEVLEPDQLQDLFCGTEDGYVFVHHPFRADELDRACLVEKGAERVRFDQRGRGGWMDIWYVGLDPSPSSST